MFNIARFVGWWLTGLFIVESALAAWLLQVELAIACLMLASVILLYVTPRKEEEKFFL